jgi:hypothetical protein
MLIELFIFFEIVALILFATAFFTKQEILWALCAVLLGVLMFTSFNVETYVYQYNTTLLAYEPVQVSNSYPYLMGLNAAFFVLALVLGIFDLYDKIKGTASSDKGGGKRDER